MPILFHDPFLAGRNELRRIPILPVLAVVVLALTAVHSYGQVSTEPVTAFTAATRDYAALHRRLEKQLGEIEISSSVDQINRLMRELAAAIRAERAGAAQGDLFTPAVGTELRARVSDALRAHDFTPSDVMAEARVEGIDYERVALRVNDTFPWVLATAMFPCVIEALPPLPPELQYRIVGRDLVLIDIHASLVVDILPAVIGEETER